LIDHPYFPTPAQKKVHQSDKRFIVINTGRRFGKSTLCINEAMKRALNKEGRYWIVSPTYKQTKSIFWRALVGKYIPHEIIKRSSESELFIELRNQSIIELKGADNPDCYDDQTEILTSEGWKLFKNLSGEEDVLTLAKDGKAEWKRPDDYIEQEYKGEMYQVKSKKLDLLVTPNHKFFVHTRKGAKKHKTVTDIAHQDRIPAQVKFTGDETIRDGKMAIMGFYLAEGSAYGNNGGDIKKRRGNYSVIFCQATGTKGGDKGDVREDFKKILEDEGYNVHENKIGLYVLNKALWQELVSLGNCEKKRIPTAYKEQSPRKLQILLHWMLMGDGIIRGKERVYYTTSKSLADDVQEIAIKAGYSANISRKKQKTPAKQTPAKKQCGETREINSKRTLYQVSIYNNKFNYFRDSKENYIKKTKYSGKIYCVGVENHTIMVRRNGKACWRGNSLRGAGLDGVILDEYAFTKPYVWEEIIQPMIVESGGWAIFISTPKGFNHFWELCEVSRKNHKEYDYFHFTTFDNPHIPKEEIERIKGEVSLETFEQEYMAKFTKNAGLVYKEFDKSIHVIDIKQSKDEWVKYRAIDFGHINPTAVLFIGVDKKGDIYVYDEIYRTNLYTSELAHLIHAKSTDYYASTYGDSASSQSIKDLSEHGIYVQPVQKTKGAAKEDYVTGGIEKVKEFLKIQEGTGQPKIFVASHCQNTIDEFLAYEWDTLSKEQEGEKNRPEKPKKVKDHALDALRMFIYEYTRPVKVQQKEYEPVDKISGY